MKAFSVSPAVVRQSQTWSFGRNKRPFLWRVSAELYGFNWVLRSFYEVLEVCPWFLKNFTGFAEVSEGS